MRRAITQWRSARSASLCRVPDYAESDHPQISFSFYYKGMEYLPGKYSAYPFQHER